MSTVDRIPTAPEIDRLAALLHAGDLEGFCTEMVAAGHARRRDDGTLRLTATFRTAIERWSADRCARR